MREGLADVLDTPTGVVDRQGLAERRALDIAYLEDDRRTLARAQKGGPALAWLARCYTAALEASAGRDADASARAEAARMLAQWAPQGWRNDSSGRARRRGDGWSSAEIAYAQIARLRTGGPGGRRARAGDALVWAARAGAPMARRTRAPQAVHALREEMVE